MTQGGSWCGECCVRLFGLMRDGSRHPYETNLNSESTCWTCSCADSSDVRPETSVHRNTRNL